MKTSYFFFNDTATTEIYTLSLHDALPISRRASNGDTQCCNRPGPREGRSEEHTSELQSRLHLVCRLLLAKNTLRRARLRRSLVLATQRVARRVHGARTTTRNRRRSALARA